MSIIEFRNFNAVVSQREIDYEHKKLDEVLGALCTESNYFSIHQDVAFATIVIGGDHGKDVFTMIVTM